MNPEEAIQAFTELNAQIMVPMHYGSFRLSFEPLEEPLKRLRAGIKGRRIEEKVVVMEEGVPSDLLIAFRSKNVPDLCPQQSVRRLVLPHGLNSS